MRIRVGDINRAEALKTGVLPSLKLEKGKYMSTLVENLKLEHDEIKAQVVTIKQSGVVTPEGFVGLQCLRVLLKHHIDHEDMDMYPKLGRAAEHDENLQILLARFRGEMNEITFEAARFFELYKAPTRSLDFARDVARLFSMLTNRIITEETVLYPRLAALAADFK